MTNEWTWGDQEVKTPMSNKSEALKNALEGLFPGTAQAIRECLSQSNCDCRFCGPSFGARI